MSDLNIPAGLIRAIKEERLVVFAGAGLSISNGLPNWKDVVVDALSSNSEDIIKADAYIRALEDGILSPLEVLDKIKDSKKFVYRSFEKMLEVDKPGSDIHAKLARLTNKFCTTNFDCLIESNSGIKNVITYDSDYNLSKLDDGEGFVMKIHGDISRADSCIVFSDQYEELYSGDKLATFQLQKLFSLYNFLFIGFSFNDPYVKKLFDYVSGLFDGYGKEHYFVSAEGGSVDGLIPIDIGEYDKMGGFLDRLTDYIAVKHVKCESVDKTENSLYRDLDGNDRPPEVKGWVGREKELSILHSENFKVVFVTGIGGEGKSALASHYASEPNGYDFIDWRDFKEEDHKFQHKIASMICRVDPSIKVKELMGIDDDELVDIFFSKLVDRRCLFVLDNVDSYIDLEDFEPVDGIGLLFRKALSKNHFSKFIFTCRPFIRHAGVDFYQLALSGLSESNTLDYFFNTASNVSKDRIESFALRAYKLTNGHALWLSLIIAQSYKGESYLESFLDKIESGITITENDSTILSKNVLSNIWNTLHEREKLLLRTLAESVVAESTDEYAEIIRGELNHNQYQKALKTLRNLNLVVDKRDGDYIELHPLVKEFVRKNYPAAERNKYISLIVGYYDKFIYVLRQKLSYKLSFDEFSNFTKKAELSINAGAYQEAVNSLREVHESMNAAGYSEEFLRVGRLLLISISWNKKSIAKLDNFYSLMCSIIRSMVEFGDDEQALKFIEKYELMIDGKGDDYIRLCDLKAYRLWFGRQFPLAIEACEEAIYLLGKGGQEDKYGISHTLALSQRDSAIPEEIDKALKYFIGVNNLEDVLSLDNLSALIDGTLLGNVGQCLQLKDDFDNAVICYSKSYYLLSKSDSHNRVINLGYASMWLSESLIKLNKNEAGYYFFRRAIEYWNSSSLVLANRYRGKLSRFESSSTYRSIYSQELWRVDKFCNDWISKKLNVYDL